MIESKAYGAQHKDTQSFFPDGIYILTPSFGVSTLYMISFDCVDQNKLWKILKEMEIPDHLTFLLKNLYAAQKAIVRNGHGQQTGSKQQKEYIKAIYCHPAYLTYMQSAS